MKVSKSSIAKYYLLSIFDNIIISIWSAYKFSLLVSIFISLENISEVMFSKDSLMLFVGDSKAVEEVVSVSFREHGAIREWSAIGSGISVLLNSLNDVSEASLLQGLLGQDSMNISALLCDICEQSLVNISSIDWVSHQPLIIWDRPGWSGHHTEGVVSLWVERCDQSVLRELSSVH